MLYDAKFATYTANPADATTHTSTASALPGVNHRKPGCRTFGDAQNSSAIARLTSRASTGHFAMSHTCTPASPRPSALPTRSAMPPDTTTPSAVTASRIIIARVSATRSGRVFQIGLPSSTS